jgi:hypothetical protein
MLIKLGRAKESLGYDELKKNKPWLDEECLKLLDWRKQAKLHWLQDSSELNGDNPKNIRHETSIHLKKKRGNIWKTKLMSLQRTVKSSKLEICIEKSMTLNAVTNLEVT